MGRLDGRVALITGAAGNIGRSTACLFAAEGARVVVGDIIEDEGRRTAEEILENGGHAHFVALDVTREDSWRRAIEETEATFQGLDILVNNAGVTGRGDYDYLSADAWTSILAINATGVFFGIKCALPALQSSKHPAVVNISSVAGLVGVADIHMAYHLAKGGIRAMTKAAAVQYGPLGIRFNSVHPGRLPPMRGNNPNPEQWRKMTGEEIPLRRAGQPEEVASAILFLASDESSYLTGAELVVDGGYTAR